MSVETTGIQAGAAVINQGDEWMAILAIIIFAASIIWFLFSLLRPINGPSKEQYRELAGMSRGQLISQRNFVLDTMKKFEESGAHRSPRNIKSSSGIDIDSDSDAGIKSGISGPGSDDPSWKYPTDITLANDGLGVDTLNDNNSLGTSGVDDV